MSLESLKITQSQVVKNGVSSAPDKLTGSAADNKAVFDNLVKTIVANSINEIINVLTSSSGAQSIGMQDLYGEQDGLNVFTAVNKMRLKVDSDKTDKTVTNTHLKNVEYNEGTGTFKFIRENGEEITVDTALEKISINFAYSPETESLIITLLDGTTQTVPLSSLISENEWNESATVKFNVSDHKVSAVVKYNSITDEHLSSTLREALISYVTEAQNYAVAAENSQNDAKNSATDAEQSKMLAKIYAENASASAVDASDAASLAEYEKQAASNSASSALSSKQAAEKAQQDAEKAAEEAKTARDEAVEIADFDPSLYVKKADVAVAEGSPGLIKLGDNASGLTIDKNKNLCIYRARDGHITSKNETQRPLVPDSIDLAVKVGLTTNTLTLTDEEKKSFHNWTSLESVVKHNVLSSDGSSVEIPFLNFIPDYVVIKKYGRYEGAYAEAYFRNPFDSLYLAQYTSGDVTEIKIITSTMAANADYALCMVGSSLETAYTIHIQKKIESKSCTLVFSYMSQNNEADTGTNHEFDKVGYLYEFIGVKEGV